MGLQTYARFRCGVSPLFNMPLIQTLRASGS